MKRFICVTVLLLLIHTAYAQVQADSTAYVTYKGYLIRKTTAITDETAARMATMLKQHLDRFPDYVNDSLITYFKTVTICLTDTDEQQQGFGSAGPGSYRNGKLSIYKSILNFPPARPVLLHEYIHAYQADKLQKQRSVIVKFYNQAKASGLYKPAEYLMKNPQEFFAMTATTLLTGSIARQPYNIEKMETEMPEYTAWLRKLFHKP